MSELDWNSIADQKANGDNKGGDVVFLNSKNLPQTFLPSPTIEEYKAVYDDETKKNRPVEPNETGKVRTQYLFHGLFKPESGPAIVKICCCGRMVAEGIASVQKTLSNLGQIGFVKVSSTGSALNTKYSVEGVKVGDKPIPPGIWQKESVQKEIAKLPSLAEMRDRLLGISSNEEKPEVGTVTNTNDDLII